MTDESGDASVDRQSPEDAFALLGNAIRVDILRALGETPDDAVAFAELLDRVDVRDSGNFNYHLGKLLDAFVRREDDGYALTLAGRRVVGAMHAGTYTADATVEEIRPGWDCLLCGGEMAVSYADERAHLYCRDCDEGGSFPFPPGSLDQYAREELPGVFARRLRQFVQQTISGFCTFCAGRVDGEVAKLPAEESPARTSFECSRCGDTVSVTPSSLATYHPAVEGFFHEHGLDTLAVHGSQLWKELDEFRTEVRSEDPPRLRVVFGTDGDRVAAEIDEHATITDVTRDRPGKE